MSCKISLLSVAAYINGFTLWHYKLNECAPDEIPERFWDDAHGMMKVGDMILVSAGCEGGCQLYVNGTDSFAAGHVWTSIMSSTRSVS